MKHRWEDTHDLLIRHDWTGVREHNLDNIAIARKLSKSEAPNSLHEATFAEEIYCMLYTHDNIYRWKYEL